MSKKQLEVDDLKPILIKLLEDEEMIDSIRGAFCRMLNCAGDAAEERSESGSDLGGGYDGDEIDKKSYRQTKERLHEAESKLKETSNQIAAKEQEIKQLKQDADLLRSRLEQTEQAQHAALNTVESERKERSRLQEENTQLKQCSALPPELASVLTQVRSDAELLKRLKLNKDLEDTAMLVQTVAVMSQESNFKRLWDEYKSRCEERKSEINPQECAVFDAALGWLNASRPDRPHQTISPAIGAPYDYEKHLRGAPGMVGETITAVWLPGVPAMKLLPLVATG